MSSGRRKDIPDLPPSKKAAPTAPADDLLTSEDLFGDIVDAPLAPAPVSSAARADARKGPIRVQVSEPGAPKKETDRSGGPAEILPDDVAALLDAFSEPGEAATRAQAEPAVTQPARPPAAVVPPSAPALARPPALAPPPARRMGPEAAPRTVDSLLEGVLEEPSLTLEPEWLLDTLTEEPEPPAPPAPEPVVRRPAPPVAMRPASAPKPATPPRAPQAPAAAAPPSAARAAVPPALPGDEFERLLEGTLEPIVPTDPYAPLDTAPEPPEPAAKASPTSTLPPISADSLLDLPELRAAAAKSRARERDPLAELSQPTSRTGTKFQAAAPKKSPAADIGGIDLAALAEDALGLARTRPGKAAPAAAKPAAPPPTPAAAPASVVSRAEDAYGPYRLLDKLAVGGMAEVFKAKRSGVEGFEKVVAVKRILPHLSDNKEFVDMFINEAKMVAGLTHPNIVQIFDLGKIEKSYYIAMEYIHGRDVRSITKRAKDKGIRIPLDISVLVVSKVCSALEYAHRKKDDKGRAMKIVHRDISPQNIMISFEGDVKLTDFGIAKAATKASTTDAGALRGKLLYMSPEQAWGKPIDRRSDIFSLGIVFYEMITEEKPFLGNSEMSILEMVRECRVAPPTSVNPRIPERLEQVVMKALDRDPDQRYQDAAAMYRDLERVLHERKAPAAAELARFMEVLFEQDERGVMTSDEHTSGEHRTGPERHLEIELDTGSGGAAPGPAAGRGAAQDPMSIQKLLKRFGIK